MTAWRRLGLGKRIAIVVLGLFVGVNLVLAALGSITGGADPGGPRSSSYATGDDGLAAFADLLALRDRPVERVRRSLDEVALGATGTLVIADPDTLEDGDAIAALGFAERGGRLVLVGAAATPLLAPVAGGEVVWDDDGPATAGPVGGSPVTDGVAQVRTSQAGRYEDLGRLRPLLQGPSPASEVVAASGRFGAGLVLALADSGVVANDRLDEADNATFALGLASDDGPVRFAEVVHGYGRSTGLRALPDRWRWAAGGLALAALVGMWAAGQRFGPPEDARRPLAPARRAHVDAVAVALARSRRPDAAVEPLRAGARRVVRDRTGLGSQASDSQLVDAADGAGLSTEDVATVLGPATTDRDLVALGAAASRLNAGRRPLEGVGS